MKSSFLSAYGGSDSKALLASNHQAAELARQAKAIMGAYEFQPQAQEAFGGKVWFVMQVGCWKNDGHDVAWVYCNTEDLDDWNATSLWSVDYPLAAYILAVRTRVIANQAAREGVN